MLNCKYNLTHAKLNVWLEGPSQLLFDFACVESKVEFNSVILVLYVCFRRIDRVRSTHDKFDVWPGLSLSFAGWLTYPCKGLLKFSKALSCFTYEYM